MTDTRKLDDEDRLPWLEAVEDDDDRGSPSAGKLLAFVIIGLLAIGLIVGGLFWMGNRTDEGAGGETELIAAAPGDYKVKPDAPGGMKIEGEGGTAFAASEGAVPKGTIDMNAVSETPITKPQPQAQPSATPTQPAARPADTLDAPPGSAARVAGGAIVQLGAFSSQAGANAAWKALSGRFTYLSPLTSSVTPVTAGGKTLYRLRASGPGAAELCGRLRVAGESCVAA